MCFFLNCADFSKILERKKAMRKEGKKGEEDGEEPGRRHKSCALGPLLGRTRGYAPWPLPFSSWAQLAAPSLSIRRHRAGPYPSDKPSISGSAVA